MKARKLVMLVVVVMLLALPLSASAATAGTIQGQGNLVISGTYAGPGTPSIHIYVHRVVNGAETLVGGYAETGQMYVPNDFTFTVNNLPQGTYKITYYVGPDASADFTAIAFK